MKIKTLRVENLKKVKYVKIEPHENMIVIAGKNGAGKSSVLDAICWALSGVEGMRDTPKPIREGEQEASVIVEFDDMEVKRFWNENNLKGYLTVVSKDGVKYSSPQKLLDGFIGKLSFDPLEFSMMRNKEQRDMLLEVLDIKQNLVDTENGRKIIYDQRTAIGRDYDKAKANLESIEHPTNDIPKEEISIVQLSVKLENELAIIKTKEQNEDFISRTQIRIGELKTQIIELEKSVEKSLNIIKELPEVDIEGIKAKIREAEEVNIRVREAKKFRELEGEVFELKKLYDDKTEHLKAIDKSLSDLLKSKKMPIDGLGFDNEGVTFNGLPFGQLSSSEQLKVSISIAMAMNPQLKVIRIMDGSLLDQDNMKVVEDIANERDYQIWIERVEVDKFTDIVMIDGEGQDRETIDLAREDLNNGEG